MSKVFNGKLAYLLSICNKFSRIFCAEMLKSLNVASRYQFSLDIVLHEPGEFQVKYVYFEFAGMSNTTIEEVLKLHNTKILNKDYPAAIGTVLALYKDYIMSGSHKYMFIPITLNYGRDDGFVHQTGLVAKDGVIMFYEPYGKYMKYGKSYKKCIVEYLSRFFASFDCETHAYHDYFNIPKGIQTIILENNNANQNFQRDFDAIMSEIKSKYPDFTFKPLADADGDNTFAILELLLQFDRDQEIVEKILECYHNYNSKTCVSITYVEIDHLVRGEELYSSFTSSPNTTLMKKLNQLFERITPQSRKIIEAQFNMNTACMKLF